MSKQIYHENDQKLENNFSKEKNSLKAEEIIKQFLCTDVFTSIN